ncbi:MAG: hypothetical protein WC783_01050 [Candidatus Paceibacterota bacterium]|jgi:hypothetical protein
MSRLIICDVQPHDVGSYINWNMKAFVKMVNSYESILVLFNGEDFGWENEFDMMSGYEDWGIEIGSCDFFDKGYAYFRGLMDNGYDIDELVKYMVKRDVRDSRDLDEDVLMELLDLDEVPGDNIFIPDVKDVLERWNGSDLCGGGANECLAELRILMDAMGMQYNVLNRWVY